MTIIRKNRICTLLKGIETGDPASVEVVSTDKYIQHNPQTHEGGEGLAALFKRLSLTSPKVNIARIFSDGDFVFGHTEYDFSTHRVGFEVFRFENEKAVEHWDNIQLRKGPNQSGHTMVDGETSVVDTERTESNRQIISSFVEQVLIANDLSLIGQFIDFSNFTEHNPKMEDDGKALIDSLEREQVKYQKSHRILAEGNFVLSVSEGLLAGKHTSYYDLFRLDDGKIVEHWDTVETIPPVEEWKNNNGKF